VQARQSATLRIQRRDAYIARESFLAGVLWCRSTKRTNNNPLSRRDGSVGAKGMPPFSARPATPTGLAHDAIGRMLPLDIAIALQPI